MIKVHDKRRKGLNINTLTLKHELGVTVATTTCGRTCLHSPVVRTFSMTTDRTFTVAENWRAELPMLAGRTVLLREPTPQDLGALVDLMSLSDATRFGLDEAVTELAVQQVIERAIRDRTSGAAFTYVITLGTARTIVGLLQVRRLDPGFEAAEWEFTIAPSARGSGIFLEAARLVGSFAF